MDIKEELEVCSTDRLVLIAERYGYLRIFSSDEVAGTDRYHATIKFSTIKGTKLTAESDFRCHFREAIISAIISALAIVEELANTRRSRSEIQSLIRASKQELGLPESPVPSKN